jgi:hypothetical protein
LKGLKKLFFCFPLFPKTFPEKLFFKRKNGKKESQKGGRKARAGEL